MVACRLCDFVFLFVISSKYPGMCPKVFAMMNKVFLIAFINGNIMILLLDSAPIISIATSRRKILLQFFINFI